MFVLCRETLAMHLLRLMLITDKKTQELRPSGGIFLRLLLLRGYFRVTILRVHVLRGNRSIASTSSFAWNSSRVLLLRGEQRISSISSSARNSSISWSPYIRPSASLGTYDTTFLRFLRLREILCEFSQTGRTTHYFDFFISEEIFNLLTPLTPGLWPAWEHTSQNGIIRITGRGGRGG